MVIVLVVEVMVIADCVETAAAAAAAAAAAEEAAYDHENAKTMIVQWNKPEP